MLAYGFMYAWMCTSVCASVCASVCVCVQNIKCITDNILPAWEICKSVCHLGDIQFIDLKIDHEWVHLAFQKKKEGGRLREMLKRTVPSMVYLSLTGLWDRL